ncbi:MAG: hypothetical protein ACXW3G_07695, partial [Rhodoplanes sp.]
SLRPISASRRERKGAACIFPLSWRPDTLRTPLSSGPPKITTVLLFASFKQVLQADGSNADY